MNFIVLGYGMFLFFKFKVMMFTLVMSSFQLVICSQSEVDIKHDSIQVVCVKNFNEHQMVLDAEITEYCKKNQIESYFLDGMRLSKTRTVYELFSGYNQNEYSFIIHQELTLQEKKQRSIEKKFIRPVIENIIDLAVFQCLTHEQEQIALTNCRRQESDALVLWAQEQKTIKEQKKMIEFKHQSVKDREAQQNVFDAIVQEDEMIYHSCKIL